MRVICCPKCNEPLPDFANFCAACGEALTPSTSSTTVRFSHRPRPLKVPHLVSLGIESEKTVPLAELLPPPSETGKLVQKLPHFIWDSTIPLAQISTDLEEGAEDYRSSGNWHKVVAPRPSHTPTPPGAINRAPTPQPSGRAHLRRRPSVFFWVSILLLVAVTIGSLLGVALTLGHGALAKKPPHSIGMSLQITPSSVALGAVISLRGTSFSPHGRIGLTRDSTIPIADTAGNTIMQADSHGIFTDTVIIGAEWQAGSHIVRAEDAHSHKTAAFTIQVTGHSPSLRPTRLLLSTSAIDLGSGDPATNSTKTLTLTNDGGGQISWQSSTTQPWLLLSPPNGTFSSGQSIQVTIAADRTNLQPGAYAAQAIFTSNTGKVMLPVKMKTTSLEPGHEPVMHLTPAVLSFAGSDGGASPPAQVVTVSNPGILPLQWSASSSGNDSWLSVSPASGDVAASGSQSVTLGVDTSNVLPGVYTATVTFTGQGPTAVNDSPQSIYVSLTVAPQCDLQVSPGDLQFASVYQQPGPAAKIISLTATQGCTVPLRWSAEATTNNGGQWLNVSSTGGTAPSYPSIGVNVTGLKPGVYTGSIIFNTTAGTQTLLVTFTMGQSTTPFATTTPTSLAYSVILGQPDPPGQAITITNTGGGTLQWQAVASTNFGGAWLAATPTAGSLSPQQSASVNVTVTALKGLTPNTYTGMVTVTATDSSGHTVPGSSQVIAVNFTVQAACSITGTPTALNFISTAGNPKPGEQSATITAGGTCPDTLDWTASISNATWLTATPATGTVSLSSSTATKIGVVVSGLSAGTYTGQVIITATDNVTNQNVGAPQTITVTLTVQATCSLTAPSVRKKTFKSQVGSNPNPDTQSFTIGTVGACKGNVTITPTVTRGWLSVSPASASISGGETTFAVTVTSASLAAGSYNGIISLAAVNNNGITITGSPQTVRVVLTVSAATASAAPSLTVSPNGLNFNGSGGTTSKAINIGNTGGNPFNWTIVLNSNAPAYVSLSAGSGTGLAGGATTSVEVIVDATGVSGGTTITTSATVSAVDPMTGNAIAGSPVMIPIKISISSSQPAMSLNKRSLTFSTTVGVNPSSKTIKLTNTGGDVLTWNAGSPSQSWLTLGLTNGSNKVNVTTAIPFNVDVTGLTSGSYTATVVITPSVGADQTITIRLTIT